METTGLAPGASADDGRPATGYRVQAVDRAIDTMLALAGRVEPQSVTQIAKAIGASKSSAFAMLQTLEARGLVDSSGEGLARGYTLGLTLARLGHHATRQVTLTDAALPRLRQLTAATKLSSRVAVCADGHAVIIGQVDGPSAVRFNLNMGAREPLHSSGIGKSILASFSDEEVREFVAAALPDRRTERTLTTADELIAEAGRIRKRGFAVDDEEDAAGILCIGATLHDHTGGCAGAISVTGLKVNFPRARVFEVGAMVRAAAEEISQRLGWRPDREDQPL